MLQKEGPDLPNVVQGISTGSGSAMWLVKFIRVGLAANMSSLTWLS